jgi:hypothetical protein
MYRMRWPAPVAALAVAALAACSSGGGDDVASVTDTDRPDATAPTAPGQGTVEPARDLTDDEVEALLLDWAQCMRDHGVESTRDPVRADPNVVVPPGTPGGNVGLVTSIDDVEDPDFEAASTTCEPLQRQAFGSVDAPDAGALAEERDRQLAFARCLREQGIEVPDPTYGDDGMSVGVGATLDYRDPEVQAAVARCSEEAR